MLCRASRARKTALHLPFHNPSTRLARRPQPNSTAEQLSRRQPALTTHCNVLAILKRPRNRMKVEVCPAASSRELPGLSWDVGRCKLQWHKVSFQTVPSWAYKQTEQNHDKQQSAFCESFTDMCCLCRRNTAKDCHKGAGLQRRSPANLAHRMFASSSSVANSAREYRHRDMRSKPRPLAMPYPPALVCRNKNPMCFPPA